MLFFFVPRNQSVISPQTLQYTISSADFVVYCGKFVLCVRACGCVLAFVRWCVRTRMRACVCNYTLGKNKTKAKITD